MIAIAIAHSEDDGEIVYREACKLGCEGMLRRGASRPISPSYRTYSRSVKLLEDGAGSAGAVRTDGSAA
jgi:ATP-dependent DNA ligase